MQEVTMELSITPNTENMSFDNLKELILKTPVVEWGDSHGQSDLVFSKDNEEVSKLDFFAEVTGKGFLVQYSSLKDINDVLYVVGDKHDSQVTEYIFGGDPQPIFMKYIVSKETLIKAIEYFVQTGKRLESLDWEDFEIPNEGSQMA